jgi:flagellar basal-body rod protein FlgB
VSWINTSQMEWLEKYLDLAAFRQTLVASNIANIDTPEYRTLDIDFEQELRSALARGNSGSGAPLVKQVEDLIERPDGNNVSLERETTLLAETQLKFQTGTALLRAEFRRLMTAIHEGREL